VYAINSSAAQVFSRQAGGTCGILDLMDFSPSDHLELVAPRHISAPREDARCERGWCPRYLSWHTSCPMHIMQRTGFKDFVKFSSQFIKFQDEVSATTKSQVEYYDNVGSIQAF
jgi:hypothetical protein